MNQLKRDHRSISIADQVFEQLERDILSGKYPRGELLSELRLSSEMGVSRTPVREAIRRLQQENIVQECGRGVMVLGISQEDMLDMYDIRIRLDGLAARRAAENMSDEELREMKEIVELQEFYAAKEGDEYSTKLYELDSQFHELLYQGGKSRMLAEVLCSVHRKMAKYRMSSLSRQRRAAMSIGEHKEIYTALASRNGDRAEEVAQRHAMNARKSMIGMENYNGI